MSFPARYESTCVQCGRRIHTGDLIVPVPIQIDHELWHTWYAHERCPVDPAVSLRPGEEVCTICWLVKPCGCET